MSDTSDPNPSIELEAEEKSIKKSSYDEKESSGTDPLQISENPDLNTYLEPADKESVLTDQRIEDEDPPTFYSVSSTTKNESEEKVKSIDQESVHIKEDLNRKESSDKDDDDSVCVVDSSSEEDADDDEDDDEETEESEEEDDEYSNSKTHRNKKHQEDDDNEEEYIKHASRAYRKTIENEDDDEEYEERSQELRFQEQNDYEGDEDFDEEDEDDYDEDRFEPEHFEGNSDDCVLRFNSNNGLNYQQKERSHSLQDVSSIKGRNIRSKNVNPFSQKARFERRMFDNENCAQLSKQYNNQDDKMCADDSLEEKEDIKKFKQSQDIRDKTVEESDERTRNSEIIKVCKSIKEYAEKTVKEVEIDDFEENNGLSIMSHPVENGEVANLMKNNFNNKERNCNEMEIELSDVETYKNDCKINGTTMILNNEKPVNKKGIPRADDQSILLNGEEESKPYTTTRNLSYDEYMRGTNESISSFGDTNYDQQLQNVPNHSLVNNYEEQEKLITLTKHLNDATIQLHQRNADYKNLSADYKNLSADYKNIISQNVELKNELENLKKLLIHYERQTKSKNKSASTAAQTETAESTNSKVNSSTQWSDDAKPSKSKYSFSHAFVTSSKIIQTLSNVTQRTKSYDMKSGKVSKAAGSNLEIDDYELVQDSKKRKATSFNLKELSKSAHPSKKYNMTDQDSKSKDTLEADECNDNDEIKVFIYPEHGTGKDQSFLIQAKEIGDNIKPGRRECGPFLLGNIEVRMAEVNGTINIWGKEVVQEATSFIEELDSKISKSSSYWQSIPESKIFNESSKKLRPDDTDSNHPCKSKKIDRHNYCTTKNQSLQDSHYSCCVAPKPSNYHECHQVHNLGCCNSHLESRRLSLPLRNKNLHCCCKKEHSKFAHQPINVDNESDDEVEITVCEQKQCQINENLYSNNRTETIASSINEGNQSKKVRGLLLDLLGHSTLPNRNPTFPRATTSQITTSSPYEKRYSHNEVRKLETQLEQFQREVEKIKSRSDTLRDMITTLHEGKRN